jgi:hypothetical protein
VITLPPIGHRKLKGRWAQFRSLSFKEDPAGFSSSITFDKPAGVVSGDFLLAFMFTRNDSTGGPEGGWTELYNETPSLDGENHQLSCFYKTAGGSEPSTYQYFLDTTQQNKAVVCLAYTGAHASPIDTSSSNLLASNTGIQPMPAITPNFVNSLMVSCWFMNVTGNGNILSIATDPPGMTLRRYSGGAGFGGESEDGYAVYEERLGAAGVATGSRTLLMTNNVYAYGITVAIRRA